MDAKRRIDITDGASTGGQEVVFSFSVEWVHTPELHYQARMQRYHDSTFLPTSFEIHWLSVINSFVLVILLTAFLTVILMRILKKDFSRYMEVDEVRYIYIHIFALVTCIVLFCLDMDILFLGYLGRINRRRNWLENDPWRRLPPPSV